MHLVHMNTVKNRQLEYLGHIIRNEHECLTENSKGKIDEMRGMERR